MPDASSFEQAVLPLFENSPSRAAWLAEARAVAWRLGEGGRTVTIDDVRVLCPPPEGMDPRLMGGVFLRRIWQRVGYASSARGVSHRRPVALFLRGDFATEARA